MYHMKKLHQTFKSKRSIIMLTTVIRSLQYTLDVAISSKMKIPDSDAIILFVNLYKLIFLGTKFTDKVLQIQLQQKEKSKKSVTLELEVAEETKECDVANFVLDTSEMSSDGGANTAATRATPHQSGSGTSQGSTHKLEQEDNYFKIKMHAMLCLQSLFKHNNKAFNINSLWHPIFPSFLINPRPEIAAFLFKYDSHNQDQFGAKVLEETLKEPTFFYLIKNAAENTSKLRAAAVATVTTLLENSEIIAISKWQNMLERRQPDGSVQSEALGQFLRLLHYYLITLLQTEKDQ